MLGGSRTSCYIAVAATLAILCPTAGTVELAEPDDLLLIDSKQLGVFHYGIPCYLNSPNDGAKKSSKSAGTFHLFLRGVTTSKGVEVSGFAVFVDSNKPLLWGGIKHENPNILAHWNPRVFVRDPVTGTEYDVTVFRHIETKRPLHLHVLLPTGVLEGTVHVAHFNRYFSINPMMEVALKSKPRKGNLEVYTAIGQFHSLSKQASLRFLKMHIDWHQKLGFAGTLVYITTEYVKYFATLELETYIDSHKLLPIQWDFFPRVEAVVHYDQSMMYHHALLSLWRRNAYVFLTDFDELLAMPQPGNIVDLLHMGCLKETQQILVDSFGAYCRSCLTEDRNELDFWQKDNSMTPLKEYDLLSAHGIGLPKILAHADYVTHIFVHSGQILPGLQGTSIRVGSELQCVWVAHLRNLFGGREKNVSEMATDESWLWPLKADSTPAADSSTDTASRSNHSTPAANNKPETAATTDNEDY